MAENLYLHHHLSTEDFELRKLGCGTCHQAYKLCPECGRPEPGYVQGKIFCKIDNVEAVQTHEFLIPGVDSWFDKPGLFERYVIQCPICKRLACPSEQAIKEIWVKELEE